MATWKVLSKIVILLVTFLFLASQVAFAAPAAKGTPIIIGVPSSFKSIEAADGLKAITLAVEEINAKGGVKVGNEKKMLKIESIETRDMEPGVPLADALLANEKLILEKKPNVIIQGPTRSEVLLAAMDMYAQYKIPSINNAVASKFVDQYKSNPEKYRHCFRMFDGKYVVAGLGNVMAKMNKEYGFKKAYIVVQDAIWAVGIANGMNAWYKNNGWEVVGFDKYPTGASDFSSTLIKAKQSGVQVIFCIFDMPQSGILVQQWKDMKVPAVFAGFISPLMGSNAWKTFGEKIEGVINIAFDGGNLPLAKYPPAKKFYEAYKKRWGEMQVGHKPAVDYDGVYAMVGAIERAGSLDPDKIAKELEKTNMVGCTGRIHFQDHQYVFGDDPKVDAISAVYQWKKGGKRVPIYPDSIAEGVIEKPASMK